MEQKELLDKHGKPVKVKKIPTRGKAKTLFPTAKESDNNRSPFDRFASTNGTRSKYQSL
jgi:hypothetical protein